MSGADRYGFIAARTVARRLKVRPEVTSVKMGSVWVMTPAACLTDREETPSVAIASNDSLGGWTKTFTDPRLCAAIIDQLTFNATIIETGTDSYRLTRTRAQHNTAPT